jgi:hypothetical protein
MITLQPMNVCMAAADLLYAKALREFPGVKVALSEGGTGWIPYFLERVDHSYELHRHWTGQDFGDQLPSDLFRERFLTCFITDDIGVQLRHDIGIDTICWEMDYPHSDAEWPNAPEVLHAAFERWSVPDADVDQITHQNAMRHYRFDPFSIRGRERCTVSALRAEVGGHDVSIRTYDQHRREASVPSLGELASRATA